jgi:hypothetical protein
MQGTRRQNTWTAVALVKESKHIPKAYFLTCLAALSVVPRDYAEGRPCLTDQNHTVNKLLHGWMHPHYRLPPATPAEPEGRATPMDCSLKDHQFRAQSLGSAETSWNTLGSYCHRAPPPCRYPYYWEPYVLVSCGCYWANCTYIYPTRDQDWIFFL